MGPNNNLQSLVVGGNAYTADLVANSVGLNQYVRFKISNPSTSSIIIAIYNFSGNSSASNTLQVYKNVTTSITTNTITPQNMNFGSTNVSAAVVTWDTSASSVSGGSLMKTVGLTTAWQPFDEDLLWIPAGSNVVFQSQALLSENFLVHVSWGEQL